MVRELIHDPILLGMKSEPAGPQDLAAGQDLLDTLDYYRDSCVGMAANMIGVRKRIIAVNDNGKLLLMYNPLIIRRSGPYRTEESCLSLPGGPREVLRYRSIKLRYETADFSPRFKSFSGFTAQIIQHETDHCDGILI